MKATCQPDMDDTQVIESYLLHQATNCFRLIYNRYASKIYAKSLTLLKDEALAEDATQEIFTKLFLNLSKFKGDSKFSTWVYSVTYNYCIDFIRRNRKKRSVIVDDIERAPEQQDDVTDQEMMAMQIDELKWVLDNLSTTDSSILLMKYQDDMSIKEIAGILSKTESAVKMQLKRAREKAKQLKQEYTGQQRADATLIRHQQQDQEHFYQ